MTEPAEGVLVRETGGGAFQVEIRMANATVLADEPPAVGGLGSGPTPYDLLAAALGACTVMTLRLYATRKQWPLTAASVRVLHRSEGLQAKSIFAREIVLEGALTSAQRQRLLEIANRCPVHETLEQGSQIVTVLVDHPLPERLDPIPDEHMGDMAEACRD